MSKHLVVLGGGFAGFWAAVAAQRFTQKSKGNVRVTLVSENEYLGIRPRFYEADLDATRVPLQPLLESVQVNFVKTRVESIDPSRKIVETTEKPIQFDSLVFALGSSLLSAIEKSFKAPKVRCSATEWKIHK